MENLVQIVNGCGSLETLVECVSWGRQFNSVVVVVDAIWPRLDYPDKDAAPGEHYFRVNPSYRFEDLYSLCKDNGYHYLKMDKFAYNGEQYNFALDYLEKNSIDTKHILFFDGDETLDPNFNENIAHEIFKAKQEGKEQLRFSSTIEILPGWKMLRVDGRTAGNFGFVWGNSIKIRREEYFDGNFIFKSPVPYNVTGIPLYHLHHLRKNATLRIFNNKFHGGGIEYDISNCPSIPDTSYIVHLKNNFKNGFPIDLQHPNNYLGSGLNPP